MSNATAPNAANPDHESPLYRIIGITLALTSAAFIGASFILKKKGLLDSNALDTAHKRGEGHEYLKSTMWWTGMAMMIVGELCNVGAYAFQPAIIVTPMGAISVVISAILSDFFLKEKLSKAGKIGCALCVIGATLLVVNSPPNSGAGTLDAFWRSCWTWGFMSYFVANVIVIAFMVLYGARRWGETTPIIFITICSLLGSFVVVALQVVGTAIVFSITNPSLSEFKNPTLYVLIAFVCLSGITQINYLNKALNIFSTAIVTPVYFVCFTTATLICSAVLFKDFSFPTGIMLVSALVGFLVIVGGVTLLFADSKNADLNPNYRRTAETPLPTGDGTGSSELLLMKEINGNKDKPSYGTANEPVP
ncbi:magnesium transporter NIPA-domain-containing protein [Chytriomyces sp. MP71]|nr:magnesium transporter NIPA-domain-containing protein [Chytriomyces sp. MP71]